jgi:hypothetical protein
MFYTLTIATLTPNLAHITVWFAPLPPKPTVKPVPVIVSPGLGNRSAKVVISVLQLPTTTTSAMVQQVARGFRKLG